MRELSVIERIEVDTLLQPIAERPAGGNLREGGPGSELYLRMKDARAAARLAERAASNAETDADPLRAGLLQWAELADGAVELLTDQTKDVEIAAWLTEALLRTGGIGGLGDGLMLLDGLLTAFWEHGLWPAPDEDGDETRLGALFGLFGRGGTGTLLQPLKLIALSDRGGTPVTLWSAEVALAPAPPRTADEEAQALVDERRAAALEALASGIARSSRAFLVALRTDLARASDALQTLMQTIDRVSDVGRFGSQIGEPLTAAIKLLEDHAGNVFAAAPAESTAAEAKSPEVALEVGVARGEPASREAALNAVLTLAEFFEKREPQSPIGLSLRETVRRARLPMEALLLELLPDSSSRTLFLQRAGIRSTISDVEGLE